MPRTLSAELEAALNSGSFQPYFLLSVIEVAHPENGAIETAQPVYFKLAGINMSVKWVRQNGAVYDGWNRLEELAFKLTRGVTVAGVNYTIDSSYYYGIRQTWDGTFQTVNACMLPNIRYVASADVTYETLINAVCDQFGKTAVYRDPTAAWLDYQFLPTGEEIVLDHASDILPMLRQKYIIFACDNGDDEILFSSVAAETQATEDHTINIARFKEFGIDIANSKRFTWIDETGLVSADGNALDSLWNLGYLESTADPPSIHFSIPAVLDPIAPNLEYLSMDWFKFEFTTHYPQAGYTTREKMIVEEEFNYLHKELGWRLNLRSYDWADGGENATMPDSLPPAPLENTLFRPVIRESPRQSAANYTPVNTSRFTGTLSTSETNIQAALDKLDKHSHAGEVTNGDSHDHNGGDGAQINFLSLANLPTAETNANDIFRCDAPGGTSAFVGTIATLPGGATLTYNITSGQEAAMVPVSTSQLAKITLYNTTRGTSALISNCNTGTNTLTLTANVPAGWQTGDTITIASQTVSGGGFAWIDLEITSGITSKTSIFANLFLNSATAGNILLIHPFETHAAGKRDVITAPAANIDISKLSLIKVTGNVFSIAWTGTPTVIILRLLGYLQ